MIARVSRFSSDQKKKLLRCGSILSACATLGTVFPQHSQAAMTVNFGKNQFFTFGVGVRGQYLTKDPAATPSNSSAASAADLRIYMGRSSTNTSKPPSILKD